MKHQSLLLLSLLFVTSSFAQSLSSSVVSSGGATYTNSTASLSFTVGQVAASTYVQSTNILTQGFQQGTVNNGNSVISLQGKLLNINMYPNPASSYIAFNIDNTEFAFTDIMIYNSLGVQVSQTQTTAFKNPQEQIHHTENLSDGVYFAVIRVKNISSGLQEVFTQKFTILN